MFPSSFFFYKLEYVCSGRQISGALPSKEGPSFEMVPIKLGTPVSGTLALSN